MPCVQAQTAGVAQQLLQAANRAAQQAQQEAQHAQRRVAELAAERQVHRGQGPATMSFALDNKSFAPLMWSNGISGLQGCTVAFLGSQRAKST